MNHTAHGYSTTSVAFIIPARNEGAVISQSIASIREFCPRSLLRDLIVLDHGSDDSTAAQAEAAGATVMHSRAATIGGVRNEGAASASAEFLVFLDADVLLTPDWSSNIRRTLDELLADDKQISGSWVGVSASPSLLERIWFKPLLHASASHINSGHLIVSKRFFLELGGFDETLVTGEDVDLSRRAEQLGGRLRPDPKLFVSHLGYPKTIAAFVRREAWHGQSDFATLNRVFTSRVASATILFAGLHAGIFFGVFFSSAIAIVCAAAVGLLCLLASIVKYRRVGIRTIVINALFYYLYFAGRLMGLATALIGKQLDRPARS